MPVLWKYLVKGYFQLFFLCLFAFIAVLLVVRFQEIALFASSGAKSYQIFLFSIYQIPYILPIAIPISSLLASMILVQRMSTYLEITAMRASGINLFSLSYPLLLAGAVLSLANFSATSEMTPITRTLAKKLLYKIARDNPLIVMQKDAILSLKTFYFDLKNLEPGKKAEDVICIMRQDSQDRITLFTAQELLVDKKSIAGKGISFISSIAPTFEGYDHLVIENQTEMQINKETLTPHIFGDTWFGKEDLLPLKEILEKYPLEKDGIFSKTSLEIFRRVSCGLGPFTLTLVGIAFGINVGRSKRKGAVLWAFLLTFFVIGSLIVSKTLYKLPKAALLLYILPHPIAFFASLRSLRAISEGRAS